LGYDRTVEYRTDQENGNGCAPGGTPPSGLNARYCLFPPVDTSWKTLGGGLEISTVDLARFGYKLLDGQILDGDLNNTIWSQAAGGWYGDAWDVRSYTVGGGGFVDHGGQWDGTDTYLRIYPEDDLVIAIMANTRGVQSTGFDQSTSVLHPNLATAIATTLIP
jgi:CubicO group peptidase (beta-lactamase class C family)